MAGGAFGLNGPVNPLNPMDLLRAKVMPSTPAPTAQPGGPPPPGPVAAPPPAPADTGPSAGGGGAGGGFFGGIGSAISNAMSGAGVFGTSAGNDDVIDPATGLSKGMMQRGNMQSLMKMGLLLLAAGRPQDPNSRARILAGLPAAMDNSDQINQFAKNRLEMARAKLLEKQALNDEAAVKAMQSVYGAGGSPVPTVAQGTPAGVPAGAGGGGGGPMPIAPPAQAATMAENPPAVVPGGVPVVPGAPGAPGPAPVAPGAPGAPGTPPAFDPATLPDKPPPAPPVPRWTPDTSERAFVRTLTTREPLQAYVSKRTSEAANQSVAGAPYKNPATGDILQDIWKNGQKVETKKIGELPPQTRDVPGPDNTIIRETVAPDGKTVTKRDTVRDPRADTASTETIKYAQKEGEGLRKNYDEVIKPAIQTYDKAIRLEDMVRNKEVFTGKLADLRKESVRWLAEMGHVNKADLDKLSKTNEVFRTLGAEAGKFAKENYGPQVSNQDVVNAQTLIGALTNGTAEEVQGALKTIRDEQVKKVHNHNAAVESYDARTGHIKNFDRTYFGASKVDRDFDKEETPWAKREREAMANTPRGKMAPEEVSSSLANAKAAIAAQPRAKTNILAKLREAGFTDEELKGL